MADIPRRVVGTVPAAFACDAGGRRGVTLSLSAPQLTGSKGVAYARAMADDDPCVRVASAGEAGEIARLLHDFNTEFDTPSPGARVLATRLRSLLESPSTFAILAGSPSVAVALLTLRTNVWYDGQVALLDELYVVPALRGQGIGSAVMERLLSTARTSDIDAIEINVDEGDIDAQRFYVRHGFHSTEPDSGERAFYFFKEFRNG